MDHFVFVISMLCLTCGIVLRCVWNSNYWYNWNNCIKATFPPNISIEKFRQSAKRIIGVSSATVVRDVFATTASFKRCTYCITHFLFVLPYTSFKPTTRALWRCRRVVYHKTLVLITQYPRDCWIQEGTRYTPRRTTTVESEKWNSQDLFCTEDWSRIAPEGLLFYAR